MNIRYPIYEGVYRILTHILLLTQYRRIKNQPASCHVRQEGNEGTPSDCLFNSSIIIEPVVFPAQIFIQVLISGIFMREIAYTDSVFLL